MSHTSKVARRMTLALTGWLLAACSAADRLPTSPGDAIASATTVQSASVTNSATQAVLQPIVSDLLSTTGTVITLGRLIPLRTDLTASAVIGPRGGTISIPSAGVRLEVPANAVDANVVFRITALAGSVVAYEFEPHGTTFKQPLQLYQSLGLSNWLTGTTLEGGYFTSRDQVDTKSGKAKVKEKLKVKFKNGDVILELRHFSGYLVSMA